MKERDIIKKCRSITKKLGGKFIKLHGSPYQEPLPDVLVLFREVSAPVFVEFKVPKKRPTEAQFAKMEELKEYGCLVKWFDDPVLFKKWLFELMTSYDTSRRRAHKTQRTF